MVMVRRGNGHRVNVLADFVQHLAVIAVLLELGELLGELLGLLARVFSSTSQMATILPPHFAASLLSLSPLPPTPMQAMLMRSLAPSTRPTYGKESVTAPAASSGAAEELTASEGVRFGDDG